MQENFGEIAALATAFFWTATAMFFEVASKRVGSLAVNMIRLIFAFIFLSIFTWIFLGQPFPIYANLHAWVWLTVSGLIGFVLGDYFLFRAYAMISSRVSMLIMTLVPPITAIIGYFWLGEILNIKEIAGMVLTVSGIMMAVFNRPVNGNRKIKLNYSSKGLLFAFIGAVGQATGLVFSKYGMQEYNAFAASQIRILAGMIGFAFIIIIFRKVHLIRLAFKDRKGMIGISGGSFFGPFLGVSFSLLAVQNTATGIASTIMAIVPVIIILPSVLIFKQKITTLEIIGAFISVIGVSLLFI